MRKLAAFAGKALVILPAHNEEACVAGAIARLRQCGFEKIRVVDNASSDLTARVAKNAGAEVISHPSKGYGLACWLGTLNPPESTEWFVFCNADASDDLEAFNEFARLAPDCDLILGARTLPADAHLMTIPQRFGNWLAPALIRLIWKHRFADLGPQRAIRVGSFQRLSMKDRGFGWTVEMQIRAVQEGLRIIEIPVRTYPRPAGHSKISGNFRGSLSAAAIILSTIARLSIAGKNRSFHKIGRTG